MYDQAVAAFPEFVFGEPTTNKKGGKSVYIYRSSTCRSSPKIQLCKDADPRLRAPFGLSQFEENGSGRMNLEFAIENPVLEAMFKEFDKFIPTIAAQKCNDWFKKSLTEAEIATMYRPSLTYSDKGYAPVVRTKVNTTGPGAAKVWKLIDGKYIEGTFEDIDKSALFWANISISGAWFMARIFGISLNCSDILVFPRAPQTFPFMMGAVADVAMEEAEEEVEPDED
jgi:hypothetical protein